MMIYIQYLKYELKLTYHSQCELHWNFVNKKKRRIIIRLPPNRVNQKEMYPW